MKHDRSGIEWEGERWEWVGVGVGGGWSGRVGETEENGARDRGEPDSVRGKVKQAGESSVGGGWGSGRILWRHGEAHLLFELLLRHSPRGDGQSLLGGDVANLAQARVRLLTRHLVAP